ncbi:Flagellar motor switch protein FliN [Sodalis glossinidius str. 'morsitans']|uniref:Flagellar motor switch protein FliN n=1 Tax=Sodalis glossinidius (strain morsitans) TaxID=343509 RepID=Q2NX05_SODGM|nr:flagellar motor switch protein FliN [Sodalis glossinidius]BAE73320.1 flagellar motor switch protein FliN [Sodalis glossinidius str. 'morsitans']CRL43639.1 Flagellar motor switch protein FliN [Sodalis glossinidius str. 'morsitans']
MSDTPHTPGDEAPLHETDGQSLGDTACPAPSRPEFPPASTTEGGSPLTEDLSLILDIPVKMTVELGRTRMTIRELLHLSQDAVVPLEGQAGEPLDILINGYLIARGEVVVMGEQYGVRIADIVTPAERMRRLSR